MITKGVEIHYKLNPDVIWLDFDVSQILISPLEVVAKLISSVFYGIKQSNQMSLVPLSYIPSPLSSLFLPKHFL